jgi:hypothetical protein
MTADHIGPISLGFVHDPANFQACCDRCNSNKGNRMPDEDVQKIKVKEANGEIMTSWWAKDAWDKNKEKSTVDIRSALDNNAKKFLCILLWLKNNRLAVLEEFVTNVYMNHSSAYKISDIVVVGGAITFKCEEKVSGKKTKSKQNNRTKDIILTIDEKDNRKNKICLTESEQALLGDIRFNAFKSTICKVLAGL